MTFSEVEAQYRTLKTQHEAGTLSEADFKARLQELMVEDDQGRWWIIGYETGQWYVHDGQQWTPGEPPRPAPGAPPEPTPEVPPPQVRAEPVEPISQRPLEKEPRPGSPAQRGRGKPWLWVVAGVAGVVLLAVLVRAIGGIDARPTPIPAAPVAAPAQPTKASAATKLPEPTRAPAPQAAPAGVATRIAAPNCDYGGELRAIEALDDFTVQFTLCSPDAGFAAKVALPPFGIHPAEYLAATGGAGELLRAPIGTGPYRVQSWSGGELRLEANPDYWGELARIPQVQFHWNDDAAARLGYLRTGDVDGIDNPSPQSYAEIQSDTDLRLYPRPGLNTGFIGFSNLIKPFDDERVRLAVALAIDRDELLRRSYPSGAVIATYFTPCEIPNGCIGEPWHDFDPDRARMLLAEAGYPDGFETELFYRDVVRSYLPDPALTAQVIAEMLNSYLNLRVALKPMELQQFLDLASDGQLPLYLMGWYSDYPDPADFLNSYLRPGAGKWFGEGVAEIEETLGLASSIPDQTKRDELYMRANSLIKYHVPMIPLVHVGSAAAFRPNVVGAHSSPLNLERFAAMSLAEGSTLVWKQASEPQSLYCADETENDTWRACAQITESLLGFQTGSAEVTQALAEDYKVSDDAQVWIFFLRKGVRFHDGSSLDAGDVVASWAALWDAASPLHGGRTGAFDYFLMLFGAFLNTPQ